MGVTLPPSPRDIVKLIEDVAQLKRQARERGPVELQKQNDVVFLNKTHGDVPYFDTPTGKWRNRPAFSGTQVDSYFDPSPVSRGSGGRLDWVIDAFLVDADYPSVGLLDLSTPSNPAVLTAGYYTFDMWALGPPSAGVGPFYGYMTYGITDSTATKLKLFGQAGLIVSHNTTDTDNKVSFSFSYPCLAGDRPFVTHQDDTGGFQIYTLGGSVKRLG